MSLIQDIELIDEFEKELEKWKKKFKISEEAFNFLTALLVDYITFTEREE